MLKFLAKLFRSEKTEKFEELSLDEIDKWIEENSKPVAEAIMKELKDAINSIKEKKKGVIENVNSLKSMELQNPNIPIKAKQYMQGNRESYANAILKWLNEINVEEDFRLAKTSSIGFEKKLDELNNETVRSYTILQEFFANEMSKIAMGIKYLSDDIKSIKGILENEKFIRLEKLKSAVDEIKYGISQKKRLGQLSDEEGKKLSSIKNDMESMTQSIEDFRKSPEYSRCNELQQEKKKTLSELRDYEGKFMQSFAVLERALRKYSHIAFEHESTALDYIASPLKNLAEDKNLVLIDILKKMEKFLLNGTLKLDEQKKVRTLEEIKKLDRNFLAGYVEIYESSVKKINEINSELKDSGALSRLNEMEIRLSNLELMEKNYMNEIAKIKSSIERIELENSIKSLEADMISFTGKVAFIKV